MRRYVARYPFISRKASVIPVGVDLDTFKPLDRARARARLELPEGPVVLYAGRLEAEKRVHVLFDAIDMLDDPPLVLVAGAGTLYTELRRKTSGRRIRFLGNVAHDEMARVIAASNVLVIPSAFEGTPTIAVEAMACGVPVIATPVGDLPLIVKPGKTGFLFDGRAESLGRLLAKRLSSMGPFRQECINTGSLFGWDRIAREVLEVLGNAAS